MMRDMPAPFCVGEWHKSEGKIKGKKKRGKDKMERGEERAKGMYVRGRFLVCESGSLTEQCAAAWRLSLLISYRGGSSALLAATARYCLLAKTIM